MRVQHVQPIDFNPLCRVTESAIDGSLMVKMMLRGTAVQQTHDEFLTLKRYIDGWLYFKEKRKYEKFWFVLKGQVMGGGHLVSAFLFCFKDQNTHVKDHFVGSTQISFPEDTIELHKMEGNEVKPWKCDFVIKLNGEKMRFRAVDNITRDRWIYALVELVGRQLPPQELPALDNSIRPRETKLRNSIGRLPSNIAKNLVRTPTFTENGASSNSQQSMPDISVGFYSSTPDARIPSPLAIPNNTTSSATLNGVDIKNIIKDNRRGTMNFGVGRSQTFDHTLIRPPTATQQHITSVSNNPRVDVPWYYGTMDREQAENLLDRQPIGTYLLRDCQSKSGCYTLTYKDHGKKKNHMIMPLPNGQYQFNGSEISKTFSSPQEGVLFYMEMKKIGTFQPKPFLLRSPGDGAEGDSSYLQTDEINKANDKMLKMDSNKSRMAKSPSLPTFGSHNEPPVFPINNNKDTIIKPPVRRVVSNPQPFATRNRPHLRKQSNIEHPTQNHERPMRRAVSLEDYEQMDPVLRSANQSCTSIPEDDDAYLTGEDIDATLNDSDNGLKDTVKHSYVNTPSIPSTNRVSSPIRKTYNPPLPPIPDTHAPTPSLNIDPDDDSYLEMGLEINTSASDRPQLPFPPPDYEGRNPPGTDHDAYIEMGPEDAVYLTTNELDESDNVDMDGYCKMEPAALQPHTHTHLQPPKTNKHKLSLLNTTTNMVIPPAPKSPFKKSASQSSIRQPPPTGLKLSLKRQQTSPISPKFPTSPLLPKIDSEKYVNNLALLMLTKSKPKNNNNSTAAPPPLPPRLAQPQRLVDQTIPNNFGNING